MKKGINRFVFWTPRILIILFALFLAIFSLDVFELASNAGELAMGLFMHNIPSLVLLLMLLISWKYDVIGAAVFMTVGIACAVETVVALVMSSGEAINPILIIGGTVTLFIGILFLIGWSGRER